MRYRYWYMLVGTFAILAALFISDPDVGIIQNLSAGSTTLVSLLGIIVGGLYATAMFCTVKAFFDYPEADFQKLLAKASETSDGAGKAAIAKAIIFVAFAIVFTLHR